MKHCIIVELGILLRHLGEYELIFRMLKRFISTSTNPGHDSLPERRKQMNVGSRTCSSWGRGGRADTDLSCGRIPTHVSHAPSSQALPSHMFQQRNLKTRYKSASEMLTRSAWTRGLRLSSWMCRLLLISYRIFIDRSVLNTDVIISNI